MPAYKPFLVSDMKTGMDLSKEPWLLPPDAYSEIENAYIYHGALTKRLGYTSFGRLKNFDRQDFSLAAWVEVDGGGTLTKAANLITNAVTTMNDESYIYKDFGAAYFAGDFEHQFKINVTVCDANAHMYPWLMANAIDDAKGIDDANGDYLGVKLWVSVAGFNLSAVECDGGALYTDDSVQLDLATDYWVTVNRNEAYGANGTLYVSIYEDACRSILVETIEVALHAKKDFRYLYAFSVYKDGAGDDTSWTMSDFGPTYHPEHSVTGILNYYSIAGAEQLLATDTRRLFKYNTTCEEFEDVSYVDTWSGGDYNFVHDVTWNDIMYMTNQADYMQQWNGTAISTFRPNCGGGNMLNSALLVFTYKSRLLVLNTVESIDGTQRQRARWSKVNTPNTWTDDEYVDADTVEFIIAAEFIGDDLIVFFERSIWKLRYTGDANLPFVWEKLIDTEGAYATFSTSVYSDEISVLGPTGIIATDGLDAYELGDKIPEFTLMTAVDKLEYAYACDLDEMRQNWLSYVSPGNDLPDRILCLNYKEKSWSIFLMDFMTFGFYSSASDLTWDEIEEEWDEIEWAWDDRTTQAGYPIVLGGTHDGYIFELNRTTQDDGINIPMRLLSGRWNPYGETGQAARLGYIDFLVDADASITLTIELFRDFDTVPYATETIVCGGDGEKVWKRIFSGIVGNSHRIQITHDGAQQARMHAIMPWFSPAGRIV